MNFSAAAAHMKAGDRVRRRSWQPGMFLHLVRRNKALYFELVSESQQNGMWLSNIEDLAARDWEPA